MLPYSFDHAVPQHVVADRAQALYLQSGGDLDSLKYIREAEEAIIQDLRDRALRAGLRNHRIEQGRSAAAYFLVIRCSFAHKADAVSFNLSLR